MGLSVPFNLPQLVGTEAQTLQQVLDNKKFCGDGSFNQACKKLFKDLSQADGVFLTPSCTSALEMALLLADIQPGDEVIVPSFTFTSTATAVALFKGVPVFVDVLPNTLNINETLIEAAITSKTKAIIPVHYAGVACNMERINAIAKAHDLLVIEDAAQSVGALYNHIPLGMLGDMGAFSFHETKNITCGEGGALLTKHAHHTQRAEILAEKGTNRQQFFRGEVDKYSWQDHGSSYLISEFQAAVLHEQLNQVDTITQNRLASWQFYHEGLRPLAEQGLLQQPYIPENCKHNGHIYYIILPTAEKRVQLQKMLKQKFNIQAVPHYVPLHSSNAGTKFGRTGSPMTVSNDIPTRLLRLPLFYNMTPEQLNYTLDKIIQILNTL